MALAGAATGITARPLSTAVSGPARAYRPDIDGLRAIAILAVVLNHAGIPLLGGGFTGVDIFFVISGYLIGGQIHAELRAGSFIFAGFYRRRAKRILPAFFAVLLFVLAAGLILLSPSDLARLSRSACAAAVSTSNILFWHSANYFDTRSDLNPMLMTWSLGIEEQFYAVIPLLLVLLVRIRRSASLPVILGLSALSFLFSWIALGLYPSLVFYMLPARAWELGAGVALAIAEQDRSRDLLSAPAQEVLSLLAFVLIVAPLLVLNSTSSFPGPAALPSVLGTALLIAAPASLINRRILSQPPLVFIGRVSYSWYLWHWPLLSFLHIVYGGATPVAITLAALAASFALAILSYFFIEQPFRRSRSAAPLPLRYAAATAILVAISATLWLTHGLPSRFPAFAQIESSNIPISSDPCLADIGDEALNFSSACVQNSAPPQGSQPALAVWGDSHAAALAPALRALAHQQGYAFAELAKASCPPILGASHFIPRHPRLAAECFAFNARVLDLITRDPRIRVIVLSASWSGYLHRSWQDGWLVTGPAHTNEMPPEDSIRDALAHLLPATIRTLHAAGKQVIVFDDVPAFDFEPQWRIYTARIPARRAIASWLRVANASDPGFAPPADSAVASAATALLQQALAGAPDATLVDLRPSLCEDPSRCMYRDRDTPLYLDNNHLSPAGAGYALRSFHLPPAPSTSAQAPTPESRR